MLRVLYLISNLAKLGVNITDRQKEALKWRLSKEGRKYYSDKETNEFYKAVKRGDTDVIDIARKERQLKIKELKKELGR